MRALITRDLLIMLVGNLASIATIWLYPKMSGFTVTTKNVTRYISGGELLAIVLTTGISIPTIAHLLYRGLKAK
jgi:hypothetical protein